MRERRTRHRVELAVLAGLAVAACARADGAQTDARPASHAAPGASQGAEGLADTTLSRLVTEIQPAVERSAGISATRPLHVAVTDEARLRAYLERQITAQLSVDEAAAITAAYARLGLVPPDIDLQALFFSLLEEQVVGYYDPRTDTLFVHDRVTVEQLEPVLAHELVHALQDQQVPLDSLTEALGGRNDASTAFQAAVEGHAMYAMLEWQFAATMGAEADLTMLPDMGPMLTNLDFSALGDIGPVEVLTGAPRVVREGLVFPYIGGLVFLQRLWKERPERPLPFGPNMPVSTEQVLHLDRWLAGDEPARIELAEPAAGRVIYERDLGELETRIFLEQHLGDRARAERAAAGWDGDIIRLLDGPAGETLVWVSAWDSPAEADEFRAAAEDAYARRYAVERRTPQVERAERDGRPLVRIIDAPPGADLAASGGVVRVIGGEETSARTGGP